MPNKFRSGQVSLVVDLLGDYFDFKLKSQEQFKSKEPSLIDVVDPVTGETVRRPDVAGLVRKPKEAEVNWNRFVKGRLNTALGFNPDEEESDYLKIVESLLEGGADLTEESAKPLLKNIDETMAFEREKFSRVTAINPETGETTARLVPESTLKTPEGFVLKATTVDRIDEDIIKHREKIEDLKQYTAVGIEPAIKAEKKTTFGLDFLARDIKAKPARYFKLVPNKDDPEGEPEKVFITKQEHDSLKTKQENVEELIRIRESKIEFRESQKEKLIGRGFKATPVKQRRPLGDILK